MGTGGALRGPENAGLEESVGFAYPLCPFLSILMENGSQDGSQNRSKIDAESIQKKQIFLINLKLRFDTELGAKMDEKSIQKRCQKRVGNDLAVNLKKSQKMTPL